MDPLSIFSHPQPARDPLSSPYLHYQSLRRRKTSSFPPSNDYHDWFSFPGNLFVLQRSPTTSQRPSLLSLSSLPKLAQTKKTFNFPLQRSPRPDFLSGQPPFLFRGHSQPAKGHLSETMSPLLFFTTKAHADEKDLQFSPAMITKTGFPFRATSFVLQTTRN